MIFIKRWIIWIIIVFLLGFILWASFHGVRGKAEAFQCRQANAECQINEEEGPCCSGLVCVPFNQQSGNGKCEPVATPTPTISECGDCVTSTPTPISECQDCVTPTPTETPVPTPTEPPQGTIGGGPSFAASTTQAHDQSCTIPFSAPIITGYAKSGNDRIIKWWKSTEPGIDHQSLVYGYTNGDERFGILNIRSDVSEFAIQGYPTDKVIWFSVWSWKNGCAEKSVWVDP